MSAGSDTTAATIRCTMLHLMTNPRVYHKLKKIVREAVDGGRVSSPIKHDEARQFPYLQVRSSKANPLPSSRVVHLCYIGCHI